MAKIRCSNCEKSVSCRENTGKIYTTKTCKATGEKIAGKKYYEVRKCTEFLPRREYVEQYENLVDKIVEMVEKGKRVKDIVDPL